MKKDDQLKHWLGETLENSYRKGAVHDAVMHKIDALHHMNNSRLVRKYAWWLLYGALWLILVLAGLFAIWIFKGDALMRLMSWFDFGYYNWLIAAGVILYMRSVIGLLLIIYTRIYHNNWIKL